MTNGITEGRCGCGTYGNLAEGKCVRCFKLTTGGEGEGKTAPGSAARAARVFGTAAHKLVRKDAPATSVAAASSVDSATLEGKVYTLIKAAGERGMISDEVREAMGVRTPYSSVTARYSALKSKGAIKLNGKTRPGWSGKPQNVMVAV